MKYFRVNCGENDGSMSDFWDYYKLNSSYDLDDVEDLYVEENQWVYEGNSYRVKTEEITEDQYNTGMLFNKMFENKHNLNKIRRKYNLYPTRELAEMFANYKHSSGYVRIGHLNVHNVYKINQDGNLIFVYHHWSDRLGVLSNE